MDGVVSINASGTATATSPLTESTWPCANSVTTHAWLIRGASLWMSSCNVGEAASAFSSNTNATSKPDKAGLPDLLGIYFAYCRRLQISSRRADGKWFLKMRTQSLRADGCRYRNFNQHSPDVYARSSHGFSAKSDGWLRSLFPTTTLLKFLDLSRQFVYLATTSFRSFTVSLNFFTKSSRWATRLVMVSFCWLMPA